MLEPNRILTNALPLTIQRLGNDTYYYNYDIKEVRSTDLEALYSFIQVLLRGRASYKDCVKAIIRKFISSDEEFDLINSYNSYILDPTEDSTALSEYKEYLNKLKEIKAKVREDFAKL